MTALARMGVSCEGSLEPGIGPILGGTLQCRGCGARRDVLRDSRLVDVHVRPVVVRKDVA